MAKMYYNEAETTERLGVSEERLIEMVRDGKLRAYADGKNKMFKVGDVDALAQQAAKGDTGDLSAQSDITLSPAASGTHESFALSDTDTGAQDDTVVTAEGISIFEDEDLELEEADPMAKTQISSGLEDQLGIEEAGGAGGSGLMDLTRESDDTSIGGAVLGTLGDEPTEQEMPAAPSAAEQGLAEPTAEAVPVGGAVVVGAEYADPTASAFAALLGVGAVVMLLVGVVALAVIAGQTPGYLSWLGANIGFIAGGALLVAIIAAVVGMLMGKKAAGRAG